VSAAANPQQGAVSAAPSSGSRDTRGAADDRLLSADLIAASFGGNGPVGPEAPSGAEPPGGEGSPAVRPAVSGALLATVALVPWGAGNGGGELPRAADGPGGAAEPGPPDKAPLLPAAPGDRVPGTLAALPLAQGLLAEGAVIGTGAVERAVNALTEPLLAAEGGSGAFLYWVGCSSWVVAAALACEAARRSWRRRTALAGAPGLPSEGEP
jgi:hypothetical protein